MKLAEERRESSDSGGRPCLWEVVEGFKSAFGGQPASEAIGGGFSREEAFVLDEISEAELVLVALGQCRYIRIGDVVSRCGRRGCREGAA